MNQTLNLTKADLGKNPVIGVWQDVHIPNHDNEACLLVAECMEDAGVTLAVLNGDVADCGPASRHPDKRAVAVLDEGTLRESIAAGLWIYEWARSRDCVYILGNHEAWVSGYIAKSPELRGTSTMELMGLWEDKDGWRVLAQHGRLRIGNHTWEHGDGIFKSGGGGDNPAARIRRLAPDQTTHIGHLHRMFAYYWTTPDEHGIRRTRAARGNGHLSLPEAHHAYMGTYMNWQQSFEITYVWYDGAKPRFTTDQVEIHRDRFDRPIFNYRGKLYGGKRGN